MNVNFCIIKFFSISVAVVINFSLRSFCMLKMPPLCHPSFAGAASPCLSGSSRWGQCAYLGLPALPALPALPVLPPWGTCSLIPGPGLMPAGGNFRAGPPDAPPLWEQRLPWYQTPDPRAELDVTLSFLRYLAYSALFFFDIHCSNSQCSKDFFCACFSSAEVTSRYTSEQSLKVLLQLQAADCEMSFVLRLVSLIVKKSKHHLIECRAAAVFSKDSRPLALPLVRRQLFFFASFFSVFSCPWTYHKKREEKNVVQVPLVLTASPPVYLL